MKLSLEYRLAGASTWFAVSPVSVNSAFGTASGNEVTLTSAVDVFDVRFESVVTEELRIRVWATEGSGAGQCSHTGDR